MKVKRRNRLKRVLIVLLILFVLFVGFDYYNGHSLKILSQYGINFQKFLWDIDYFEEQPGPEGTYYYVVHASEKEKGQIEADWKAMPLSEEERVDFDTGFRFLREAGKEVAQEYIPNLNTMKYRYYYFQDVDRTNITVIDPANEDCIYIMLVIF